MCYNRKQTAVTDRGAVEFSSGQVNKVAVRNRQSAVRLDAVLRLSVVHCSRPVLPEVYSYTAIYSSFCVINYQQTEL